MNEWTNESMNEESVYRTAPATAGLLNSSYNNTNIVNKIY